MGNKVCRENVFLEPIHATQPLQEWDKNCSNTDEFSGSYMFIEGCNELPQGLGDTGIGKKGYLDAV